MNDNLSEMRDFILDYDLVNSSLGFVLFETFITATSIGLASHSTGWGIGSFIIILVLYGIPLIGGVFTFVFSFVEAIIISAILSVTEISLGWVYFIGVVAFVILIRMHRIFGAIDNPVLFGYSLIIFDDLLICGILYLMYNMRLAAILIFIAVLVAAFIPVLRIVELIVLCIGTAVFAYGAAHISLGTWQSVLFAGFALIYSGSLYYNAYSGVDYKGMVSAKKKRKIQEENRNRCYQIKTDLYARFPELEKNYYYYYTEVCKTDFSKMQFDYDWNNYLEYLYNSSTTISFNEYFEQEKLYRSSHYNSDFAKKHSDWKQSDPHDDIRTENDSAAEQSGIYFAGVDSLESLKKRYRDLLKIYHPDNQNGDNTISKQIQQEYEELLKEYSKDIG